MLFEFSKGFRLFFVISLIASGLAIAFNYLMPQVFRVTVDSILGNQPFDLPQFALNFIESIGGRDFLRNNLVVCAVAASLFAILSGVFNFICRITMAKSAESIIADIRNKLFSHIQRLPYSWHIKNQTGDTIQRCTADVEVIRGFLTNHLGEMVRTVLLLTLSFVVMFSMNPKLTWIAMASIPLVTFYSGFFATKIMKKFKVADEAEGDLSSMVQENFTGVRVVRAFGRQAHEIERFDQKNNLFANLWIKLGYITGAYWGVGDIFSSLQVMAIIVFGVFECLAGNITAGEFIVFITYNQLLVWPVRSFGRIISEMSKTGVSLARVNEILDAKEEQDSENSIDFDMKGDIEFKNVQFNYQGVKPVLKDISFKVKEGTTFGILGGTGSGKSTLMYLLDRLYDLPEDCGEITIGGININNIKLETLRKNIGFVLQEPFLFSKTIKENIGISKDLHDINDIRQCAKIAAVDESIIDFANGYDTIVGERGVTLSGGQKQRVAIARMLMQQSPIMVFDDSLSAVDSETDSKIRASLKQNIGKSTVILISHRITTLMHADQIIVLDDGEVSQIGTHDELANKEGIYKQIYEMQGRIDSELEDLEVTS